MIHSALQTVEATFLIGQGCPSGVFATLDGLVFDAAGRPDYTTLRNLTPPNKFAGRPGASIASQELFRDRLNSVASSVSAANRPASISEFAERIEATGRMEATDRNENSYFGALHNDGHLLISMHDNEDTRPGAMFWEETALRDPVFYRWHTHIDEMFRQYEDSLGPQEIGGLPPVDALQLAVVSTSDQLNVVTTEMRTRTILKGTSHEQPVEYLSHEDFWYLIHVYNKGDSEINTTVRIFMAPENFADDRRAWIEMDKFHCRIAPGSPTIIERSSTGSAVVRHPVQTTASLEGTEPPQNELGTSAECRCGWPYTLLLPRGTSEGLEVRFIALFTSGDDLKESIHDPNSASYCGLRDGEYPDKRPMGFPFDRPLKVSLREWIEGASQPAQLAHVQAKIVHRG